MSFSAANEEISNPALELYAAIAKICRKVDQAEYLRTVEEQINYLLSDKYYDYNNAVHEEWYDCEVENNAEEEDEDADGDANADADNDVENYSKDAKCINLRELISETTFYALTDFAERYGRKCMETAKRHKDFADMYSSMVEPSFAAKAMPSLNKAIIWAPAEEVKFLVDCFLARSDAHKRANDFQSALLDIEQALQVFESIDNIDTQSHLWLTIIERKLFLLKQLERFTDVRVFLDQLAKPFFAKRFTDSYVVRKKLKQMQNDWKQFKRLNEIKDKKTKDYIHDDVDDDDDNENSHFLQIDDRIQWSFNTLTERYQLESSDFIPTNTVVVDETPILYVVRANSVYKFCNHCFAKCGDTFWPCRCCSDVIFCSRRCADQANQEYHHLECGMLHAIASKRGYIPAHFVQVYRHLVRVGHTELLALHRDDIDKAELEIEVPDLSKNFCRKLSRSKALQVFAQCNASVHRRMVARRPRSSASDLASAFYAFAIYCYKADVRQISVSEMCRLVAILATEMAKTFCAEYGWYECNDAGKRINFGNYQCLISSHVGHQCEPNLEWKFNGCRFQLVTLRPIEPNEEFGISFGPQASSPFWLRITQLRPYLRMCRCVACWRDARRHFALRCTRCCGPIPFDREKYPYIDCLQCELPYEHGIEYAIKVEQNFRTIQRCIWAIHDIANPSSQKEEEKDEKSEKDYAMTMLESIENRMSTLAMTVDIHNRQLLATIDDLCNEYIRRGAYDLAVEWYQWLASYSGDNSEGFDLIDINEDDDADDDDNEEQMQRKLPSLFDRLRKLDRWAFAYVQVISCKRNEVDDNNVSDYIIVAKRIFALISQTFTRIDATITAVESDQWRTLPIFEDKKFDNIMIEIRTKFIGKYSCFLTDYCESSNEDRGDKTEEMAQKQQTSSIKEEKSGEDELDEVGSDDAEESDEESETKICSHKTLTCEANADGDANDGTNHVRIDNVSLTIECQ